MKKFISVRMWRDLTDKHLYHEGDPFPFDGREVPEPRLKELEFGHNQAGLKMIQGIITEDAPKTAQETKTEPEAKTEPVKKAPARRTAAKKK